MASKTQMYSLLRLIDYGAKQDVIAAAQACWQELPEETRALMCTRGGTSDTRRARLWAAAWEGAEQAARQRLEDLYVALAEDLADAGIGLSQPAQEWVAG